MSQSCAICCRQVFVIGLFVVVILAPSTSCSRSSSSNSTASIDILEVDKDYIPNRQQLVRGHYWGTDVHVREGQGYFRDPRWGYGEKCSFEEISKVAMDSKADDVHLWGNQDIEGTRKYAKALAFYLETTKPTLEYPKRIVILNKEAFRPRQNPLE